MLSLNIVYNPIILVTQDLSRFLFSKTFSVSLIYQRDKKTLKVVFHEKFVKVFHQYNQICNHIIGVLF